MDLQACVHTAAAAQAPTGTEGLRGRASIFRSVRKAGLDWMASPISFADCACGPAARGLAQRAAPAARQHAMGARTRLGAADASRRDALMWLIRLQPHALARPHKGTASTQTQKPTRPALGALPPTAAAASTGTLGGHDRAGPPQTDRQPNAA